MSHTNDELIAAVRRELAAQADPGKAPGMQAYMKSAMPYYGAPAPVVRRVTKQVFAAHPLADGEAWQATALALWRGAAFREERYAAIELTGQRRYAPYQTRATLPMYEEMIVTGAWWDYVDAIAIHRLGPLFRVDAPAMTNLMLAWSRAPDLWQRRSAIICQIARKTTTDLNLLYACIEPNLADRDFFIRKAIGWALRAYAWIDPAEIIRYVESRGDALSPLSRREALKNAG